MKLVDRLLQIIENNLDDETMVSRIKDKILAPSLSILKQEIDRSGTHRELMSMIYSLLWPVILMMTAVLLAVLLSLGLQLYLYSLIRFGVASAAHHLAVDAVDAVTAASAASAAVS